jgi:hypothetical protein
VAVQKKSKSHGKRSSTDSVRQWVEELIVSLHECKPPLPIILIKANYLKSGIDFDTVCGKDQLKDILDDLVGCGEDVNIQIAVVSEKASVDRLKWEARKGLKALKKDLKGESIVAT